MTKVKRTWTLGELEMGLANDVGTEGVPPFSPAGIVASIIIIDDNAVSVADKAFAVDSVFSSITASAKRAELFILTDNDDQAREYVRVAAEAMPEVYYRVVKKKSEESLGAAYRRVIALTSGGYLCFTTTACVVPEDWLANFYEVYGKDPEILGSGGFVGKQQECTIFDEYEYFSTGIALGVSLEHAEYPKDYYEMKNSLFYQNPAGILKNVSYRRRVFEGCVLHWEGIDSMEMLESAIRFEACKMGDIMFQPRYVFDLEKMDARKFRQRSVRIGAAHYAIAHAHPVLARCYTHPLRDILQGVVTNILIGYWKFKLTRVIFVAGFFRLIGHYSAAFTRLAYYLKSVQ